MSWNDACHMPLCQWFVLLELGGGSGLLWRGLLRCVRVPLRGGRLPAGWAREGSSGSAAATFRPWLRSGCWDAQWSPVMRGRPAHLCSAVVPLFALEVMVISNLRIGNLLEK